MAVHWRRYCKLLNLFILTPVHYAPKGVSIDTTYTYYVETVNTSGLTSTIRPSIPSHPISRSPGFLTVDYVSVIDRSTVELQFTADIERQVNDFRVMRRSNPGTPFTKWKPSGMHTETQYSIRIRFRTLNQAMNT